MDQLGHNNGYVRVGLSLFRFEETFCLSGHVRGLFLAGCFFEEGVS
jgi:hypothetical protein